MGYLGTLVLGGYRRGWAYGRRWRGHGDWDETFKAVVVCSIRIGNGLRLYFSSMGEGVIEGFQVEGSTRGRAPSSRVAGTWAGETIASTCDWAIRTSARDPQGTRGLAVAPARLAPWVDRVRLSD